MLILDVIRKNMKALILTCLIVVLASGCSHKLKELGKVKETVKEVKAVTSDSENLYMNLLIEKEKSGSQIEEDRWVRMSRADAWERAKPVDGYVFGKREKVYPATVKYDGVTYDIYLGRLSNHVTNRESRWSWEMITSSPEIQGLEEMVEVHQLSGSEIDPQNPIFREADSDLFLFMFPSQVPQLVLLDREERKALLVREFQFPKQYVLEEKQYDAFKSAAMPLAKTADAGALIIASPVLIPVLLNADFSGK